MPSSLSLTSLSPPLLLSPPLSSPLPPFLPPPLFTCPARVAIIVAHSLFSFTFRDVCAGMEYISSQMFVHRDLAARNVLLNSNGKAKVEGMPPFLPRSLLPPFLPQTLSLAVSHFVLFHPPFIHSSLPHLFPTLDLSPSPLSLLSPPLPSSPLLSPPLPPLPSSPPLSPLSSLSLSDYLSLQISDFGMAQRVDVHVPHEGGKFPIKWTAPEALKDSVSCL